MSNAEDSSLRSYLKTDKVGVVSIVILTVIGAVLRYHYIFEPVGWDEAKIAGWTVTYSALELAGQYSNIGNHIFHTLLCEFFHELFGDGIFVLRFPTFFFGTLLIPASYFAFRRLVGESPALLTAALCAISPYLIYASTNARGYIIQTFFVVALIPVSLLVANKFTAKNVSLFVAICFLAFYTLPTTIFFIPGLFLLVFFGEQKMLLAERMRASYRLFFALSLCALFVIAAYAYAILGTGVSTSLSNGYLYFEGGWYGQYVWISGVLRRLLSEIHWSLHEEIVPVSFCLTAFGAFVLLVKRNASVFYFLGILGCAVFISLFFLRFGPSRSQLYFVPFYYLFLSYGIVFILNIIIRNKTLLRSLCLVLCAFVVVGWNSQLVEKQTIRNQGSFNSRYYGSQEFVLDFTPQDDEYFFVLTTHMGYWINVYKKTLFRNFQEQNFQNAKGRHVYLVVLDNYSTPEKMHKAFEGRLNNIYNIDDFTRPSLAKKYGLVNLYKISLKIAPEALSQNRF